MCCSVIKIKWNSNFLENPFQNCGLPPEVQMKSSFSAQNGTMEISLPFGKFPTFQSHRPKTILRNLIANGKCTYLVGLLILEKPLPLFNSHPNQFILTNGKHPICCFRIGATQGWKKFQTAPTDQDLDTFQKFFSKFSTSTSILFLWEVLPPGFRSPPLKKNFTPVPARDVIVSHTR